MRSKRPEFGLERLLTALGRELLEASDEEVLDAAVGLRPTPDVKNSANLGTAARLALKDRGQRPPEHASGTSSGAGSSAAPGAAPGYACVDLSRLEPDVGPLSFFGSERR